MSTTSFANVDEVLNQPAPQAPATTGGSSEIVSDDFFSNDGFDGEIDQKAIRTPYLSLVHGVGGLAEKGFTPGALVYNSEVVMAEAKKGEIPLADAVEVILLRGFQEYIEDTTDAEYKAGIKPRRWRKESEARAEGLVSPKEKRSGNNADLRTYRPAAQFKVLIAGKTDGFPIDVGSKNYALGALSLTKGSYWGAGTTILNFVNDCRMLKRPIFWKSFKLTTKLEKFPGSPNATWSIKAVQGNKLSPEEIARIQELNA